MASPHRQLRRAFSDYLAAQRACTLTALKRGPQDATAVHRARVAIKKTRAAIRLLGRVLTVDDLARQQARLRTLARTLARARDASARTTTLDQLAVRFRDQLSAAALARARRLVTRRQSGGGDERARYASLVPVAETAWTACMDWASLATPGRLRRGLEAALARARRAFRRARAKPTAARLHRWRKRVKDLLYQCQLLRTLGGTVPKRCERAGAMLARCLGAVNDLGLLRDDLRMVAGGATAVSVAPQAGSFARELRGMALELGERFHSKRMTRLMRTHTALGAGAPARLLAQAGVGSGA